MTNSIKMYGLAIFCKHNRATFYVKVWTYAPGTSWCTFASKGKELTYLQVLEGHWSATRQVRIEGLYVTSTHTALKHMPEILGRGMRAVSSGTWRGCTFAQWKITPCTWKCSFPSGVSDGFPEGSTVTSSHNAHWTDNLTLPTFFLFSLCPIFPFLLSKITP